MTGREKARDSRAVERRPRLREAEISKLLQEATQKYEECMRLADLADVSDGARRRYPRYAWDNPIGLVVTGTSNAQLV